MGTVTLTLESYLDVTAISAKILCVASANPPTPSAQHGGTVAADGDIVYKWNFGDTNQTIKWLFTGLIAGQSNTITASFEATRNWIETYWIDEGEWVVKTDENGDPILDADGKPIKEWVSDWQDYTANYTTKDTGSNNLRVYTHPIKFAGFTFGLTLTDFLKASEWTEFEQKVQQYDAWKNQSPSSYNPKTVSKGDKITAQLFKDVADKLGGGAIVITPNVTPIEKKLFQDLVTAVNRGVE